MIADIHAALEIKMERRWSALWSPAVRMSLFIAAGFLILQQVTGINTILYYGPQIFSLAGIASNKNAIFATLLVAITNVLATIIALVLVDRVGRKPLLYAGVGGMTVSLLMLAYSFHDQATFGAAPGVVATICLMVYITCFAFSMGPIAWILVLGGFSAASSWPRSGPGIPGIRRSQFCRFPYLPVAHQSGRKFIHFHDLCRVLYPHAAFCPLRHPGNKRARIGNH